MVNDAFGCHQCSNDMVNDREMGAESSHIVNDDVEDIFELMQDGQEVCMKGVINILIFFLDQVVSHQMSMQNK